MAGCVQWLGRTVTGFYEGFAIIRAIEVSYFSFVLICVSHHKEIYRLTLFVVLALTTSALAAIPAVQTSTSASALREGILDACNDFSRRNNKP